ncbi:MAG: hypothetical protein IPI49_12490 [Myxococcales bacterium]|nr:hypothetical protein [Myxococcales bacterium]
MSLKVDGSVSDKAAMKLKAWNRTLLGLLALIGCSKSEPRASGSVVASASPAYLQLRISLYNRTGMTTRLHLRFAEGDDSYNYIRAGEAYIGLFHDPELVRRGKALVSRECKRLSAALAPVSLAEAALRPEDSAAFMDSLMKGEKMDAELKSADSVAKVAIACAEPRGGAWMSESEFKSVGDVESLYGAVITEAMQIGDAAAAAATPR